MSDILEKSLSRLKDRSGTPVLNDPDSLIDSVMKATEPSLIPMWLTAVRICSSVAAVLLIVLFIGVQQEPKSQMTAETDRPVLQIEDPIQYYNNSLIVAEKVSSIKNSLLCEK